MNAGVGLIVLAAIFAFGVVLFCCLMIALLPGATFLDERIEALREQRSATRRADQDTPRLRRG